MDTDMTEQDYELLSQYLDGELTAAAAQALRQRLLAEPELRAAFEQLKKVDDHVKSAFDIPGVEAVPARITQMLENTGPSSVSQGRRAGWGLAVAASLIAATALLLTPEWGQQPTDQPIADSLLANVLEHSPSRSAGWDTLADGRQVRPVLSFADSRGGWCREYLVSGEQGTWRGVACRGAGSWTTEVLSADALAGSASEYRPAGATSADQINVFIDTHSADVALSLQAEADLIARKWQ